MRRRGIIVLAGLMCILIVSCKKNVEEINVDNADDILPAAYEKTVALNKEVARVLESVYQDPKAVYEVSAAVLSEYYEDESVLLKDLLFPGNSALYNSPAFIQLNAPIGIFKTRFYQALSEDEYPLLKKALYGNRFNADVSNDLLTISPATDTAAEIFSNSKGVSIYFPYSENFGTIFSTAYFDNINKDPRGKLATIVAADREADSGPGREPYIAGTYRTTMKILYQNVIVDDAYAELNPTHIISVGAEPKTYLMGMDSATIPGAIRVYHGSSILSKQLDRLISFTGNGGGSEIKVCRISGYLDMKDQQVTTFESDMISIQYKRKDIRKKRGKYVMGVWDPYWKKENLEQVYAVWENDTEGTKKFSGSLKSTLKATDRLTVVGDIGFDISVKTQDEIITQRKLSREAYLLFAKQDQGCGFHMLQVFGQNWPWYDCGTIWRYTWPYKTL